MAQFTQTTTFANGQTADGGQVNTEIVNLGTSVNNIVNAQIASNASIAITKTDATAATTYTPTLYKNDGVTVWNTTQLQISRYSKIGKMVHWVLSIVPESGANGNVYGFTTLPVAARNDATYVCNAGAAYMTHSANASGWPVTATVIENGTRIRFAWASASGTPNGWNDITNPTIFGDFVYESAA